MQPHKKITCAWNTLNVKDERQFSRRKARLFGVVIGSNNKRPQLTEGHGRERKTAYLQQQKTQGAMGAAWDKRSRYVCLVAFFRAVVFLVSAESAPPSIPRS